MNLIHIQVIKLNLNGQDFYRKLIYTYIRISTIQQFLYIEAGSNIILTNANRSD